jgi:formate dehydrogenase maturation protein FdhE
MPKNQSQRWACPFCGTQISMNAVLIEYESNGQQRCYAECSVCDEPVHPVSYK